MRAPHEPRLNAGSKESASGEAPKPGGAQERPQSPPLQQASVSKTQAPVSPSVQEYVRKSKQDSFYDWKQPISFYGQVKDETEAPVSGAVVHFKWNDLSAKGTSAESATTDSGGLFSLTGRKGKRLYVEVAKAGYYSSPGNPLAFEYANPADGLFTPNPASPVVFHLRKRGRGTVLVTSEYGARQDFPVHLPRDGTAVKIDLMERKLSEKGQILVAAVKPEYESWKMATNWFFKMEVPDGGFVEQNDEFPFEAPEGGYQPVVEFSFEKGSANWTEELSKNYYIKFGVPARYGRLHVQTGISYGGATLTYCINPDGSRNLEPKQ